MITASEELPRPLGRISDYGQTLERSHRELLARYIAELEERGIRLFYLASWRDPYGDPVVYAREIFRRWGLGERDLLLVFLREGGRRWRVAFGMGPDLQGFFPEERLDELRRRAERDAARGHVAGAVLGVVRGLLDVAQGRGEGKGEGGIPWWPLVGGGLGAVYLLLRAMRAIREWGRWV